MKVEIFDKRRGSPGDPTLALLCCSVAGCVIYGCRVFAGRRRFPQGRRPADIEPQGTREARCRAAAGCMARDRRRFA